MPTLTLMPRGRVLASFFCCADMPGVVLDINRVAAVIQTVVSKDGKIYGTLRSCIFPGSMDVLLMRVYSRERLEEKWNCCGILITFCLGGKSGIVYARTTTLDRVAGNTCIAGVHTDDPP